MFNIDRSGYCPTRLPIHTPGWVLPKE